MLLDQSGTKFYIAEIKNISQKVEFLKNLKLSASLFGRCR
jgi:hypothetical protein